MDTLRPLLVACIPAYNEEKTIAGVIVQAMKYVDRVLVCDDGSGDLTGEIAEGLGADVMVMLDGDGQHDPDEIPRLEGSIVGEEADVVVGARYVEGSRIDAPLHRTGNTLLRCARLDRALSRGCEWYLLEVS